MAAAAPKSGRSKSTALVDSLPLQCREPKTSTEERVKNQLAIPRQLRLSSSTSDPQLRRYSRSSEESLPWSGGSSESDAPLTPITDPQADGVNDDASKLDDVVELDVTQSNTNQTSTKLLTRDLEELQKAGSNEHSGTALIRKYCCGGGCCFMNAEPPAPASAFDETIDLPGNDAFQSLELNLPPITIDVALSNVTDLPPTTVSLESSQDKTEGISSHADHPPSFVQPHPPYHVFSAPLYHARELTKRGAAKRTFHFDIDVSDYPEEGDIDFKVGGAVGICPPNSPETVEEIFNVLGIPKFLRDAPVTLKTSSGRWPTIWGDESPRELQTTRRDLLTWCSDIQSYPPTKPLLRFLAEHATAPNEKKILTFLTASQGQGSFCDLRTGPHLTLLQLLYAFPSSKPPLPELLSVLPQLMPRFYSLSNDPHISSDRDGLVGRRIIEIAVTVHESPDWRNESRTGVGSGFLERLALQFIEAEKRGEKVDLRIPMFRGLMANPLSKEFGVSDGPMMLIGAGVGMAPFRGFILNRLRNANCASKIWLVQGVRDSSVDELYSGELGKYEAQIKKVVQSRAHKHTRALSSDLRTMSEADLSALRATDPLKPAAKGQWQVTKSQVESRYVQDEVRQQGDVVWDVINSVDGRIFVCGSTKGMGEGVEEALVDVAMKKGGFELEGAKGFWQGMKDAGKYIAETW